MVLAAFEAETDRPLRAGERLRLRPTWHRTGAPQGHGSREMRDSIAQATARSRRRGWHSLGQTPVVFRPYELPDGRVVQAGIVDESGGDAPELGPLWELAIQGDSDADVSVGHPLNSTLAELLGWNVAHEEWPAWIDELAAQIESDSLR